MRRTWLIVPLDLLFMAAAQFTHATAACDSTQINPVIAENCQTDPASWSAAWKVDRQEFAYDTRILGGYASRPSVNRGETLHFYIHSNFTRYVDISFYRLGWYHGVGGRLVASVQNLRSTRQPSCHWQNSGSVEAYFTCSNWRVSYSLTVPIVWTSGIYVASIRARGFAHDVLFVVRDDQRNADFIYQTSMATEQAYNAYHYGPGLYSAQLVNGQIVPVAKASFERPYDALDNLQFYRFELPFIFWMESQGYDVAYVTDVDMHERAAPLAGSYKAFILAGHSEYWSRPMYDAVETARDSGVHLGFFGGDLLYWQMRLEDEIAIPGDSTHEVRDRVMVVFRHRYPPDSAGLGDPNPDPALQTIYWRDFPIMRDEQALVGVHFTHPAECAEHVADWASAGMPPSSGGSPPRLLNPPQPLVVADATAWPYDGTGLRAGDTIPAVYGQEADSFEVQFGAPLCGRSRADPPARAPAHRAGTLRILASSPFTYVNTRTLPFQSRPTQAPVNSMLYQACSGAWVFAAGDIMWGDVLAPAFILEQDYSNGLLQQVTGNIMDRFAGRRSTPSGGACVASFPVQLPQTVLDALSDR